MHMFSPCVKLTLCAVLSLGDEEALARLSGCVWGFRQRDDQGRLPLHRAASQLRPRVLELVLQGQRTLVLMQSIMTMLAMMTVVRMMMMMVGLMMVGLMMVVVRMVMMMVRLMMMLWGGGGHDADDDDDGGHDVEDDDEDKDSVSVGGDSVAAGVFNVF